MAFDLKKLNIVADKFGGQAKVYSYVGADDYTASNYFDPVIDKLAVGDIILAADTTSSGTADICVVTSVTSHVSVSVASAA